MHTPWTSAADAVNFSIFSSSLVILEITSNVVSHITTKELSYLFNQLHLAPSRSQISFFFTTSHRFLQCKQSAEGKKLPSRFLFAERNVFIVEERIQYFLHCVLTHRLLSLWRGKHSLLAQTDAVLLTCGRVSWFCFWAEDGEVHEQLVPRL